MTLQHATVVRVLARIAARRPERLDAAPEELLAREERRTRQVQERRDARWAAYQAAVGASREPVDSERSEAGRRAWEAKGAAAVAAWRAAGSPASEAAWPERGGGISPTPEWDAVYHAHCEEMADAAEQALAEGREATTEQRHALRRRETAIIRRHLVRGPGSA